MKAKEVLKGVLGVTTFTVATLAATKVGISAGSAMGSVEAAKESLDGKGLKEAATAYGDTQVEVARTCIFWTMDKVSDLTN